MSIPKISGTKIAVDFFLFPDPYPPLYYSAGEGTYNLASVNAGRSNGLDVGGGGVNLQFLTDLTAAGQKRANLQGAPDDYQDRHMRLLARALADPSRTAFERYTVTDPCVFSYAYAAPVTQNSGWHDGICFVDVFDASLLPAGNGKNVGMLYVAPPSDTNYANQAAFLQAIEATGRNMIEALAGYNALAPAQKLPTIEALRLTLYSSAIYNQNLNVDHGLIAQAIWRGLLAGIQAFPNSGLLELQLPAGTGTQEPLFGVLRSDPALTGVAAAPPVAHPAGHPLAHPMVLVAGEGGGSTFDEDTRVFDEFRNAPEVSADPADESVLTATAAEVQNAMAGIRTKGQQWAAALAAGNNNAGGLQNAVPLQPVANDPYGALPQFRGEGDYDAPGAPMGGPVGRALDAALSFGQAIEAIPDGDSAAVRQAIRRAALEIKDLDRSIADAETAHGDAINTPGEQQAEDALRLLRAMRARMGKAGLRYVEAARQEYTARRAAESARFRRNVALGVVIGTAIAGVLTGIGVAVWKLAFTSPSKDPAAKDLTKAFGPRRASDTAEPALTFDVIGDNVLTGMVTGVTLSNEAGGTWAVNADKSVLFTAPAAPVAEATATYTLALTNGTSLSGTLKALFAADLVVAPADRTSAVVLPGAGKDFAFVVALATPSPWSITGAGTDTPTVTFTPGTAITAPYVRAAFTDARGGAMLSRYAVILFPAQTLSDKPANRVVASLTAIPSFVGNDEVSVVLLSGTLQVESTSLPVTGGTWTVDKGTISFTPDGNLPAGATPVSVQYALKYGKTRSAPSTATLNYPAVAGGTAVDQTVYVLSRTQAVVIPVAGATVAAPLVDTYGTWSSNATSVTFTPANVPATGVVTASHSFSVGSSQATLTVVFAAPTARTLPGVSRVGGKVLLPAPAQEVLPANASVWLWNGTAAVKRIQSKHAWSVAADGKTIEFTPAPQKFVEDGEGVAFVFSDGTVSTPLVLATVNFSKDTVAWPITATGPIGKSIEADTRDYCYVESPKTIVSVTLTNNDPTRIKVEGSSKPTFVTFDPGGAGARRDTANYQVTDSANGKSNTAPIIVNFTAAMSRRALPVADNCLIAKSAAPSQVRIAAVLDGASAYYGVDASTVKLVGPVDLGGENTTDTVGLTSDGKSMFVPNQGVWLVDGGGAISFHADANFAGPPMPVAFTFADKKGNVSAPALVTFDDDLANLANIPQKIKAVDDTKFWSEYRSHVSRAHPAPDVSAFLVATHSLAYATGLAAKPEGNPVELGDYDDAYQAWLDGGQAWDDPPGTQAPVGLVSICEQLVAKAMPAGSPAVLTRYWRLQHMAHMAAQSLPAGGTQ